MMKQNDLSSLEPLYDKKYQCPLCLKSFTSKKVRSRFIKPQTVESDFGPIYKEGERNNPLFYYVIVCPQCGFAFTEEFGRNISQTGRQQVMQEITTKMDKSTDYCTSRDFEMAVRTYKLAIYTGQLVKEKHTVFANICLRLSWLYRGAGRIAEEQRFLQLAATEFEQSYIISDFNPDTVPEMQILYLIGELNRKLGKYNEAVRYFSMVAEHQERSRYIKYVNLAREQWKKAVEEYREKKETDYFNELGYFGKE